MQTEEMKRQIVREPIASSRAASHYGIHEMCLMCDNLDAKMKSETERALTGVIHHGVRPRPFRNGSRFFESEGFRSSISGNGSDELVGARPADS